MDTTTPATSLDLDRVDFGPGPSGPQPCVLCHQAIEGRYWTVEPGGTPVCESCQPQLDQYFSQKPTARSLGGAMLWGLGAAVLGAAGWWAFGWVTGYELGLIAIAVGYGVGWAVRRGSGSLGGRVYQVIALVLTYLAITGASLPYIVQSMLEEQPDPNALAVVLTTILAWPLALVMPFLVISENVIGLLLMGFALYQAWQLTGRAPVTLKGPLRVGVSEAP